MAIVISNSTATANTADATTFTTGNFTSNANSLYLATVCVEANPSPSAPLLTGGGQTTWDQVASVAVSGTPPGRLTVYRALSASPGAAAPLVVDAQGSTMSGYIVMVNEVTNVDSTGANGANAIVQAVTAQSSSTQNPSVAFAAFGDATNNVAYGTTACITVAATISAQGGYTGVGGTPTHSTPSARAATAYFTGQKSAASFAYNTTSNGMIIGLELKFSASGSGVVGQSTSIRNALYRRRRR